MIVNSVIDAQTIGTQTSVFIKQYGVRAFGKGARSVKNITLLLASREKHPCCTRPGSTRSGAAFAGMSNKDRSRAMCCYNAAPLRFRQ
jgi:hypothetical protein